MKSKSLLFLLSFFILISCDKKSVYSEFYKNNEDNRWLKSDSKTFQFTIEDSSKLYDIDFNFSHVYDYQFASVPIDFEIENPKGEKEKFTIDLMIKDNSGKEIGDCSGDICDLKYKIKPKTKLEKGTYKIIISNGFKREYLPNVIGLGIEVSKLN